MCTVAALLWLAQCSCNSCICNVQIFEYVYHWIELSLLIDITLLGKLLGPYAWKCAKFSRQLSCLPTLVELTCMLQIDTSQLSAILQCKVTQHDGKAIDGISRHAGSDGRECIAWFCHGFILIIIDIWKTDKINDYKFTLALVTVLSTSTRVHVLLCAVTGAFNWCSSN